MPVAQTHTPSVSWPLAHPPYAVQAKALAQSQGRRHFGLWMEMGLGKTATVLAEFHSLLKEGRCTHLLIVCPNSLKGTWVAEMQKMGCVWGSAIWPVAPDSGYTPAHIINYEAIITKKGALYLQYMVTKHDVMLVIDESTQIKNPQARRTKALIAAAKSAAYVRLLSGAPVVQGPQDLWSQLRCLGQFNGVNYYAYRNHFCKMGGYLGKQVVGVQNEQQLNAVLQSCSFRAKKDEWLDLPKKIYTTRHVELSPEQAAHYANMKKHLLTLIDQQTIDVTMVITQMLKLQQIGSGFLLDGAGQVHTIGGKNPRLELLKEIMEQVTGKVLIFTWFRESARQIVEALKDYHPELIQGGIPNVVIEVSKGVFEKVPRCRVMVCQIQTGRFGHTFLGGSGDDRCATTIFYENSFSLDSRLQAEDRNHRIGQDKPVVYIDIASTDIDRMTIAALQKKQDVASLIIDNLKRR